MHITIMSPKLSTEILRMYQTPYLCWK